AVDGAGNPVATGATPPAWDKVLPANDTGDPCRSSRFTCVMGGQAVLDNETGLVWEKSPETNFSSISSWGPARVACLNKNVGGRKGWRLPSVQELSSLVNGSIQESGLNLPPGHPFILDGIQIFGGHWSATMDAEDPTRAWKVDFNGGIVESAKKNLVASASPHFYILFWCVRGGGPLSEY
ncbi:MAG: DUF1566 domain-containing protein, partial [Nitrospirales bacterium]